MGERGAVRIFVIVAKTRLDLLEYFTTGLAGVESVNVILDRRLGHAAPGVVGAASGNRREKTPDVYDELESRGFVIVRLAA